MEDLRRAAADTPPGSVKRRVAIVSLGRAQALGEARRVESWRAIFEAAGAEVTEVPVERVPLDLRGFRAVVAGYAGPERLAWSGPRLIRRLDALEPSVIVAVTTRAFEPRALTTGRVGVLDFVDSLGRSYRDRGQVVTNGAARVGYRALAAAHARVERRAQTAPVVRVAAGWADAADLGATWVPNVCATEPATESSTPEPDRDVIFFGTLRYPPNLEALDRLSRMWPAVQASRPGTTALVAGAHATTHVRELCAANGWELVAGYASLGPVLARARLAVAPLTHAAGIQNKVLEAAGLGTAQVVTSAALAGFAPGFPVRPADDDHSFVAEIVRLLDDPAAARLQAQAARRHVMERYSPEAWRTWAGEILDDADRNADGVRS